MKKLPWVRILAIALTSALILTSLFAAQGILQAALDARALPPARAIELQGVPWLVWVVFTPAIYALVQGVTRRLPRLQLALIHMAAGIAFVAAHVVGTALVTRAAGLAWTGLSISETLERALVLRSASELLAYTVIAAICHIAVYISALQDKDAALRESQEQRIEAITTFAGALAHDFNNLLTSIGGFADLALDRVVDEQVRKDLQQVRASTDRASDVTRQLLAVSRGQVLELQTIDLRELLRDVLRRAERKLPTDIELEQWVQDDELLVRVDREKLSQALLAGLGSLRERLRHGDRIELRAYVDPHRHVVVIELRDTGRPIPPAQLDEQLEPINLLREGGLISGLGLLSMAATVRRCGGMVSAEALGQRGNVIRISLPQLRGTRTDRASPAALVPIRQPTILVAEDETSLRLLARRALERRGFTVLTACDGEDALEVAAQHPNPIDLLVTDVVMPRLGGVELARELAKARPGISILYISGYAADEVLRDEVSEMKRPFLEKPFTPVELVEKVGVVLNA